MNNQKKIVNLIILDESGSMQSIKDYVIRGFNETIQTIRGAAAKEPALEQWINFYSFNSRGIREQIPLSPVQALQELNDETYKPDSGTPLYDAVGYACNKLRKEIQEMEDVTVLVTILTDGEENASREYDHAAIAALISELKSKGWVFTYIGANHDVEKFAISINIRNFSSFSATKDGVSDMMMNESRSRMALYNRVLKKADPGTLNENYFKESEQSS